MKSQFFDHLNNFFFRAQTVVLPVIVKDTVTTCKLLDKNINNSCKLFLDKLIQCNHYHTDNMSLLISNNIIHLTNDWGDTFCLPIYNNFKLINISLFISNRTGSRVTNRGKRYIMFIYLL